MTSTIFHPRPSHVRLVALDKTTTIISDNFHSPWGLGPRFGVPLTPQPLRVYHHPTNSQMYSISNQMVIFKRVRILRDMKFKDELMSTYYGPK